MNTALHTNIARPKNKQQYAPTSQAGTYGGDTEGWNNLGGEIEMTKGKYRTY